MIWLSYEVCRINHKSLNLKIFIIPNIPTPHYLCFDSTIEEVMQEEFTKANGFPAKFEIEYWDVNNLAFNDGTAFQKQVLIAV